MLRHLALNESNRAIATALGVSEETVKTHVGRVRSTLQVENRAQAAVQALERGVVSLDELSQLRGPTMSLGTSVRAETCRVCDTLWLLPAIRTGGNDMARLTRRGFVKASTALAAAPALAALPARAQGPAPDTGNLRVEKDIVFGKGASMDLTLDVYRPPEGVTSKRLAIVHLFGGGFFTGSKNAGYIVNDAKALGARGYTSVSANYRLQNQGSWPAQLHDVKAAIRWTRANADRLGIDPARIVVAGYSAGGMLALMAAGTNGRKDFEGEGGNAGVSSDVNACIGVYPLASAQTATRLFPEGQATPENIAAASPTSYISKSFAPTIFIHGTNDGTVPAQSSIDFYTKLHALGVPSALTLIQGADHAFDNGALDAVELMAHSIDLFLDRLIIDPRPYPSFGAGGGGRGRGGRGGARGRGGAAPGRGN